MYCKYTASEFLCILGPMQDLILSSEKCNARLQRMALEILERTHGNEKVFVAGIRNSGFNLATIVCSYLSSFSGRTWDVYSVKLDKVNPLQSEVETNLDGNALTGAILILVDDVQNSGKTMMYAIRHFLQFPLQSVQTCVLVDRSHNRFPVRPDYVGLSLSTTLQEHVSVEVVGNEVKVYLA